LLTAALNTLYRDVAQLVGLAFTLGFFLTPVVYDTEAVPAGYRTWLLLNPVATVIHGVRIALFRGELPSLADTWPGALASVVLLAIGWMAFRRLQSTFTEVL
ncbi:MAG: ABC transporter permease, partial [Proteobacteria bacterium]|nr:ABC transporter permease [Pseudomonadota bacterium]